MKDLEIDIENRFRKWVAEQGGQTYKWTGGRKKLDLIVVTHTGVIGLLEMKRPKTGRLRPQQEALIEEVDEIRPGVAFVCDNLAGCAMWYDIVSKGVVFGVKIKPAE